MTHSIQNFSFHLLGDLSLTVPGQKRDERLLWPLELITSAAKTTWNLPAATVCRIKGLFVRKEVLEQEIEYWIRDREAASSGKGKEPVDGEGEKRLTTSAIDALVKAFTAANYASLSRKKIQSLIDLCDPEEVKEIIDKVIEEGIREGDECLLNLRALDACDFSMIESILSNLSKSGSPLSALRGEINEVISAQQWTAFRDDSVRVVPMLYSTMRSSGRYLLKLMELIVMASSKLGLVIFGNAVKIKGKELSSMATPIQLFLVYLAANYLVYNTTIGAEMAVRYTLFATGVTTFGYIILAMAVVYPVFRFLSNRFQPCPIEYKSAENVTELARVGELRHVFRRGKRLDDFINCLERNGRVCLHGEKGSGKKTMKESLAKRIVMGELREGSPLANRKLFSFDMKNENALEDLKSFIQENRRYKDEVVVFVENGFKFHGHGEFESQLRALLKFPFVVLSVNDKNWIEGKFSGVTDHRLDAESDEGIIIGMMKKYAEAKAPHLHISESVIRKIYNKSENKRIGPDMEQPGKALTMLAMVIDRDRPIGQRQLLALKGELADKIVSSDTETVVLLSAMSGSVDVSAIVDMTFNRDQLRSISKTVNQKLEKQERIVKRHWETVWLKAALDQAQLRYAWKLYCRGGKEFDTEDPRIQRYMKKWAIIKKIVVPCLEKMIEGQKKTIYESDYKGIELDDRIISAPQSSDERPCEPYVRVIDCVAIDSMFPESASEEGCVRDGGTFETLASSGS